MQAAACTPRRWRLFPAHRGRYEIIRHGPARSAKRGRSMLDSTFTSALAAIVPASALLTEAEDTRPYECDGLTLYRERPGAVVLPENEAQVVAILRLCHAARVPVVARGAGTSLSGGALPAAEGIVLSLAKLRRIIEHRCADAHGDRPTGRAQSRHFRSGGAPWPLLRARSVVADRLLDRRQRRRKRRRRPLPEIWADRSQRAQGARRARQRRHRRVRQRRTRFPGIRPARTGHRQRRPARHHDRDHRQAAAQAATGAGRAGGVRRYRKGRRGRRQCHRRGHHSGRPRDDGPPGNARRRGIRARRLSARRGGGAADRGGRYARRGGSRNGGDPRCADGERRHGDPRIGKRSAAPAVLVRPQGGVSRGGPHFARLLLHRRHDSARGACPAC